MISTVFQESGSMGRLGPRSYEMCGAIRSLACDGCDGGANCLEFVRAQGCHRKAVCMVFEMLA